MGSIIQFGKHYGESIYSIYKVDRGYCRWLYEQGMFVADSEIGRFLAVQFKYHNPN